MRDDISCLQNGIKDVMDLDPLLCDSKIAHEYALFQFNNLATAIVGHAQLALNNPTYDSLKRSARMSSEFGQKVADLARSLLVFSGGSACDTSYQCIDDLLRQVISILEPVFERVGIEVKSELGKTPLVEVDGVAMREILFSLLNHRMAPSDGAEKPMEIHIRTFSADGIVNIVIEYRNIYMPRETLDQCCVPLFNLSTVRPSLPADDAGKSLTGSIGGRSRVTADVSYPDTSSTTLTIGIPICSDHGLPRTARVLVVDDEPVILSIFSRFIAKAGHAVDTASSGAQALEMIGKSHYDIVLLDWMMPGMSGAEVLQQAVPQNPKLPFVIVTAAFSNKVASQAMDAGAMECIGKPLNHKKVLYLIDKYTGGATRNLDQNASGATQGHGEVLLVAESDPLTRDLYHLLFDNAGYECSTVATYEECVESLEKEYFDAILMNDSLLRSGSAERLRSMRRLNPYTPVLIIGDIDPVTTHGHGTWPGAAAFLEKPLEFRRFLQQLRTILDLYQEPSASRYKI